MLLAGDIGGTKTHLAVYDPHRDLHHPLFEARFPSDNFPNLETLALTFLKQVNISITHACFGVAGPVLNGEATITNLPWQMSESRLQKKLKVEAVTLLNDLQAAANAVPSLVGDDIKTIHQGDMSVTGNIAVVAPGTGLGEAYLTWDGSRYHAYASEGGHTDFGPNSRFELEMLRYLQERRGFEHVSYEHVCSGIGIPNIYDFLKNSGYGDEPSWLAEQLSVAEDPTPIISRAAMDVERPCPLCITTLNTFVTILGSEAGNLALKVMALGGVYLGGGIPPRVLSFLQNGRFLTAFLNKGRMSAVLNRIPVHVIINPNVALMGAARYGLQQIAAS